MENRMPTKGTGARRVQLAALGELFVLIGLAASLATCGSHPGSKAGASASGGAASSGVVTVDIIALQHPPVLPILGQIDQLLGLYGGQVHVTHYDFDTKEGASFAKKKGLSGHIPLVVFTNGKDTFTLDGRKITFESFPQGQGTFMVANGAWTMADLEAVLKQVVGK